MLCTASADIYISEVLYNPFTSESGGEAVELYNSGSEAINLSGYTLNTASKNSTTIDATFPSIATIPANGYYLIADNSWDDRKDSILYPDADYQEPITMKNTDSGLFIADPLGNILDAVGWGSPINLSLYKGTPTNDTENGESLQRIAFTDDNYKDFISAQPTLNNSRGETRDAQNNAITLNLNILEQEQPIANITFPYDLEGKVILEPGRTKSINVTFFIKSDLNTNNISLVFNNTNFSPSKLGTHSNYDQYYAEFLLDHFIKPDNYTLSIVARTPITDFSKNISFEITSLMAFEIDLATIDCNISLNLSCLVVGDTDTSTYNKPTIRNIGNKPLDFKIYGANFSSQTEEISIETVKFSFDENPDTTLTNEPVLYPVNLKSGPDALLPLSLLINLPQESVPGTYATQLIFMGVTNE